VVHTGAATQAEVAVLVGVVNIGVPVVVADCKDRVRTGMTEAEVVVDHKDRVHRGMTEAEVVVDYKDRVHRGMTEAEVVVDHKDRVHTAVWADTVDIADIAQEHHPIPKDGSHHLLPLNCAARQTVRRVTHTYMD